MKSLVKHEINIAYIIPTVWTMVILVASMPIIISNYSNEGVRYGSFCLHIVSVSQSTLLVQIYSLIVQTCMIISLAFILVCYIKINSIMFASKQNLGSMEKKAAETKGIPLLIILVTMTNTLCWLPLFFTCVTVIAGYELHPNIINTIVGVAMPLNSLLNPCIYTFGTKSFRDHLREVLLKNNK